MKTPIVVINDGGLDKVLNLDNYILVDLDVLQGSGTCPICGEDLDLDEPEITCHDCGMNWDDFTDAQLQAAVDRYEEDVDG